MKSASMQAARGWAAVAVLLCHADLAARHFSGESSLLSPIFVHGSLGVDFFFVLSGFVVTKLYADRGSGEAPSREFFSKRLAKIFPPYLPLGIGVAVAYILFPDLSEVSRDWSWAASLTLLPGSAPALTPAWTLQHEMAFYILFSIILLTGRFTVGFALWGLAIFFAQWAAPGLRIAPLALIDWNFVFGGLAALHLSGERSTKVALLAGLALLIICLASPTSNLAIGLAFSLILPAIYRARVPALGLSERLGNGSYSIYLIHVPVVALASRLFADAGWAASVCVAVSLSIVAAYAYHRFWETKASEIIRAGLNLITTLNEDLARRRDGERGERGKSGWWGDIKLASTSAGAPFNLEPESRHSAVDGVATGLLGVSAATRSAPPI